MTLIGEALFCSLRTRADLSDVLRHNLEKEVPNKVERIAASEFSSKSDDELIAAIVEECRAEPLELRLPEAVGDVKERTLTVRSVFGENVTVPGLSVSKVVPFDGEAAFFDLKPNTWDMNPPYGQVRGRTLVVGMEVRESDSESAVQHIEETLTKVQTNIDRQKSQIAEYNNQLPGAVAGAIERRRATLGKASDLAARLRGQ